MLEVEIRVVLNDRHIALPADLVGKRTIMKSLLFVSAFLALALAAPQEQAASGPNADAEADPSYGYYGYYGKRSADAEPADAPASGPNAEAEADPWYGYYGYGYRPYGYGYYGYGHRYGYYYGKRSADAEPADAPASGPNADAEADPWYGYYGYGYRPYGYGYYGYRPYGYGYYG